MTISHSDIVKWAATKIRNGKVVKPPEPYTDFVGEHNCKPRKVYCNKCKYVLVTDIPGPRCGKCHTHLVSVPKPNELAR